MKRTIRIEKVLPHPVDRVWAALTDPRLLGSWLMENDFAPKLHHQFTFHMKPQRGWDGITHCEVIELDAPRRVAYTYRGEATGEKTLACATSVGMVSENVDLKLRKAAGRGVFTRLDTVLRFTLTPESSCDGTEKTHLLMEHEGFTGLKLVIVSVVMGMGWKKRVIPRLESLLDRVGHGKARTVEAPAT
jgi:uncharacterized protein YndB with AHSA1/START domain